MKQHTDCSTVSFPDIRVDTVLIPFTSSCYSKERKATITGRRQKVTSTLMAKRMLSAESQTWRLSPNSVTVKTVTFITLCYLSLNRVFAEAPKIRRKHSANTMVTTWHGKSRPLRLPHRLAAIVTRVIQMAPKHSYYLPSRNVTLD